MSAKYVFLWSCLVAILSSAPAAALAQGRSSMVLSIGNAYLLNADGSLYRLPLDFDRYHHSGYVLGEHGPQRKIAFTDGYETWNEGFCEGACANFPPEDNRIGRGGYVHAESYGILRLGLADPGFSHLRADAARDRPGASKVTVSNNNTVMFIAETAQALALSFDATPYGNLFLAMSAPMDSSASAEMRMNLQLRDLSTGELVNQMDLSFANQIFQFHPQPSGDASFIYAPGAERVTLPLNPLTVGHAYQVTLEQSVTANVLLTVPEPPGAHQYGAGVLVVAMLGVRSKRRQRRRTGQVGDLPFRL